MVVERTSNIQDSKPLTAQPTVHRYFRLLHSSPCFLKNTFFILFLRRFQLMSNKQISSSSPVFQKVLLFLPSLCVTLILTCHLQLYLGLPLGRFSLSFTFKTYFCIFYSFFLNANRYCLTLYLLIFLPSCLSFNTFSFQFLIFCLSGFPSFLNNPLISLNVL